VRPLTAAGSSFCCAAAIVFQLAAGGRLAELDRIKQRRDRVPDASHNATGTRLSRPTAEINASTVEGRAYPSF